ncbi:MAG: hypothetical protein WAP03_21685 [Methylorubrum rhodinum]|uniref:hypothetical protein n=1 Tax=Methylorubrum rhodinum TaxID=29428 RepID=UPI003BAF1D93
MLNAADLAGFDLPALVVGLQDAAIHQDRCRRQAQRIGIPADAMHTRLAAVEMDKHAAAIAEGARLVALIARFAADQNERRPAAPVIRLVPRPDSAPKPVQPSARGVVAKLAGLFGGRTAKVA